MQATRVCCPEAGRVKLEEFTPPSPGWGEVLIESLVTLISPGTERAWLLGLPNTPGKFPSYPGYCNVGRIAAVGEGVADLTVGDRIASTGSHASHVCLRRERCWKVPEGLSAQEAVYCNLVSIALQGVRKARVELGEAVLVVGLGLIGNLALQLARLQGGFPALGMDLDEGRREIAMACGADDCFDPADAGTTAALERATEGRGPAVVIEATGSPAAVNESFALAGEAARVVLLASTRGVTEANFYRDVHRTGLVVLGAHASARPRHESSPGFWTLDDDTRCALRLLHAGRLHLRPLTTGVFPAENALQAYEALTSWRKDALGMLLRWKEG
jgi:threonine dehydrogenase-like Zn-dependent dehydrogenase